MDAIGLDSPLGGPHDAALRARASSTGPSCRALRLRAGIDAQALGDEIERLWLETRGPHRSSMVALSVVQTCGRSVDERERDALRLLRLEADGVDPAPSGARLLATLVSVDVAEHLLLLAAAPAALDALVARLSQRYPLAALFT
ncbi:MAG TPA: hypothetical protein VEA81_18735 [Burkholderiaceae bacterium]|nr:hypothetical protein [Burkholderiaceae bacterium]